MKTIEMSNYSVGESCYNEIPSVCEKYNVKKVVLIGGKRALAAAEPRIREAIKETDIIITDSIVYGIECTMTNVHKLTSNPNVQEADVIFAIGGGKLSILVKLHPLKWMIKWFSHFRQSVQTVRPLQLLP